MFRISRIDSFINDSLSACCVSSGCGNKIAERAPHQQVALSDRGRQKRGGWVGWSGGGGCVGCGAGGGVVVRGGGAKG